ncbi:MAG: NAD(P)/FAD-dependent oxidoreductase, partial [Promethearchaeota archaeon]
IVEEHSEVGFPFQCAGIVSKKLATLIHIPKKIILNRVKVARLIDPSGNHVQLSGDEEPYIIDRIALDKLFYEKNKTNANVIYYFKEKFKSFQRARNKSDTAFKIKTSKRVILSKMLVGCDGPLSIVGKLHGIKNNVVFGAQVRANAHFNNQEVQMLFNPRLKNFSFAWVVPEGNEIYRIGLAAENNPYNELKTILNDLGITKNHFIDRQGGIIPIGLMNKIAFNSALLLGDSACQVKSTTGGGIVMLLICARHAANCISKCFSLNKFSRGFIRKYYEKPCRIAIGRELKIHFMIRTLLNCFSKEDYNKFFSILKTNRITQSISLYGDMDFPKHVIFKLLKDINVIKFLFSLLKKKPVLVFKILKIVLIN